MRYSFEFKMECVDKYRQGLWPITLDGIKEEKLQLFSRVLAGESLKIVAYSTCSEHSALRK